MLYLWISTSWSAGPLSNADNSILSSSVNSTSLKEEILQEAETRPMGPEDCTQIIRIDPLDIPAYVRRGFAHLSLGEYQQALEDSNKAIILSFNQTTAHSWLSQAYAQRGDAHQALGNSNEAIENYQKSLDIAPNDDLQAKLVGLKQKSSPNQA